VKSRRWRGEILGLMPSGEIEVCDFGEIKSVLNPPQADFTLRSRISPPQAISPTK